MSIYYYSDPNKDLKIDICFDCFKREAEPYFEEAKDNHCCVCQNEFYLDFKIGGYFDCYFDYSKNFKETKLRLRSGEICDVCAPKFHEFK